MAWRRFPLCCAHHKDLISSTGDSYRCHVQVPGIGEDVMAQCTTQGDGDNLKVFPQYWNAPQHTEGMSALQAFRANFPLMWEGKRPKALMCLWPRPNHALPSCLELLLGKTLYWNAPQQIEYLWSKVHRVYRPGGAKGIQDKRKFKNETTSAASVSSIHESLV